MNSSFLIRWFGIPALTGLLLSCSPAPQPTEVATPTVIKAKISATKSPVLLVHAWATWCDPCRDEFPELIKVHEEFSSQGLQLLLIAADEPSDIERVKQFLADHNSTEGSLIASALTEEFVTALSPNWGGSLPASFFYVDGKLVTEWEGKRSHEEYAEIISELLKR